MKAQQSEEFMKLDFARAHKKAKAKLRLLLFMTEGSYILYIPSLNLTAYGTNEVEARKMLDIVIEDYFLHLSQLSEQEVLQEIKQYGWVRKPYLPKQLRNIQFVEEKTIKEDFELPAETIIREQFVSV